MKPLLVTSLRTGQRGISIIAAIFLLLLFAALAAMMANLTMTGNASSVQDFQGARAYQAARAGVEWGLYSVMQAPANASPAAATDPLAGCFASPAAITAIPDFTVSVSCELYPTVGDYQEGSRNLRLYRIVARATTTGPGGGIERELVALVEKCRDTAGMLAPFDC